MKLEHYLRHLRYWFDSVLDFPLPIDDDRLHIYNSMVGDRREICLICKHEIEKDSTDEELERERKLLEKFHKYFEDED